MDELHPAAISKAELLKACDVRRLRRGGPGGQHRNKVETAVVVRHRPTGISAEANERRSQAVNLRQALLRLRIRLALEVRTPYVDTHEFAPSELWRGRVSGGKIQVSREHDDFPTLLAEAIDATAFAQYELPAAAKALGVSPTQLARFLQLEPAAWQRINQQRQELGLRPLL